MLDFKIGDRVTCHPQGQSPVVGMLTRYNKKTVTVITESRQQWNVAPRFLGKAVSTEATEINSKAKSFSCERNESLRPAFTAKPNARH